MVTDVTNRWAVIDVETNGLSARRHRILQIAVVNVAIGTANEAVITDEWCTYARPFLGRVGPSHIHGITRESLRSAPRFADIAPDLVSRLNNAVIVAHNLDFDWPFLRKALKRSGYRPPDARRLCTLRLSRSLDPDRTLRHRLPDVAARHGVELVNAHHALNDARATALLLPSLLAQAGDRSSVLTDGTTTDWGSTRTNFLASRLSR
jgi:DNA polymerase III subunit epsilon